MTRKLDSAGMGWHSAGRIKSCRKPIWLVLAVAVGLVGLVHGAHADLPDGASHVMSFPTSNPATGAVRFTTTVGFTDFSGVGYQPVEIVFTSPIATTADVRLNYRITNSLVTQTPDDNRMVVDIPIFVPQGTKTKKWIRYFPKWMMGHGYEVSITQDGRELPGFGGVVGEKRVYRQLGSYLDWERQAAPELRMELLLITPNELSPSEAQRFNSLRNRNVWSFDATRPWNTSHERAIGGFPAAVFSCGLGNLPQDWRGYQRWDAVVLTKATIEKMKPLKVEWNALRGWALCGGTLIVWDVESQSELESLFDIAVTAESGLTAKQSERLGFSQADLLRAGLQITAAGELRPVNFSTGEPDVVSGRGVGRLFGVPLGAGKAVAVGGIWPSVSQPRVTSDSSSTTPYEAGLLFSPKWDFFARLMRDDVSSILRRGAEPILGNAEYKKWLVPGVAQPPVYTLVAFLTIFVVLVGPVAYRRTTRSGRGHLMFVIAPLLAFVTTVSMFAYSLVVDGFSTIGRIRQITWVDGATGTAGERVRQTYFAPISPRAGLVFPGDAEVFSVRRPDFESWQSRHNVAARTLGTVRITEKMQQFNSSFLPSREQKQFVSYRPRFDVGRLTIAPVRVKDTECQVTNDFKFRIGDAVVRDRDGTYRRVQNLQPGQSQIAVVLEAAEARQVMGKYYLDHNPVAASGSTTRRGRSWNGEVYDLSGELSANVLGRNGVRSTEGRFEVWLREALQLYNELPTGCFVAICDVTQDATAVEGCEIDSSVHYVIGTLP